MPKPDTAAALRFCLSRVRLLILANGDIAYFPSGNWATGWRTSRIRAFVVIDNLRILAWQAMLLPLLFLVLVGKMTPYHLGFLALGPAVEIAAAMAMRRWARPVRFPHSYNDVIWRMHEQYPAVYKRNGYNYARSRLRPPLVLAIFIALIGFLAGGGLLAAAAWQAYCLSFASCRSVPGPVADNGLPGAILLLIAVVILIYIRREPERISFDV